jgi:hypothetical protein
MIHPVMFIEYKPPTKPTRAPPKLPDDFFVIPKKPDSHAVPVPVAVPPPTASHTVSEEPKPLQSTPPLVKSESNRNPFADDDDDEKLIATALSAPLAPTFHPPHTQTSSQAFENFSPSFDIPSSNSFRSFENLEPSSGSLNPFADDEEETLPASNELTHPTAAPPSLAAAFSSLPEPIAEIETSQPIASEGSQNPFADDDDDVSIPPAIVDNRQPISSASMTFEKESADYPVPDYPPSNDEWYPEQSSLPPPPPLPVEQLPGDFDTDVNQTMDNSTSGASFENFEPSQGVASFSEQAYEENEYESTNQEDVHVELPQIYSSGDLASESIDYNSQALPPLPHEPPVFEEEVNEFYEEPVVDFSDLPPEPPPPLSDDEEYVTVTPQMLEVPVRMRDLSDAEEFERSFIKHQREPIPIAAKPPAITISSAAVFAPPPIASFEASTTFQASGFDVFALPVVDPFQPSTSTSTTSIVPTSASIPATSTTGFTNFESFEPTIVAPAPIPVLVSTQPSRPAKNSFTPSSSFQPSGFENFDSSPIVEPSFNSFEFTPSTSTAVEPTSSQPAIVNEPTADKAAAVAPVEMSQPAKASTFSPEDVGIPIPPPKKSPTVDVSNQFFQPSVIAPPSQHVPSKYDVFDDPDTMTTETTPIPIVSAPVIVSPPIVASQPRPQPVPHIEPQSSKPVSKDIAFDAFDLAKIPHPVSKATATDTKPRSVSPAVPLKEMLAHPAQLISAAPQPAPVTTVKPEQPSAIDAFHPPAMVDFDAKNHQSAAATGQSGFDAFDTTALPSVSFDTFQPTTNASKATIASSASFDEFTSSAPAPSISTTKPKETSFQPSTSIAPTAFAASSDLFSKPVVKQQLSPQVAVPLTTTASLAVTSTSKPAASTTTETQLPRNTFDMFDESPVEALTIAPVGATSTTQIKPSTSSSGFIPEAPTAVSMPSQFDDFEDDSLVSFPTPITATAAGITARPSHAPAPQTKVASKVQQPFASATTTSKPQSATASYHPQPQSVTKPSATASGSQPVSKSVATAAATKPMPSKPVTTALNTASKPPAQPAKVVNLLDDDDDTFAPSKPVTSTAIAARPSHQVNLLGDDDEDDLFTPSAATTAAATAAENKEDIMEKFRKMYNIDSTKNHPSGYSDDEDFEDGFGEDMDMTTSVRPKPANPRSSSMTTAHGPLPSDGLIFSRLSTT